MLSMCGCHDACHANAHTVRLGVIPVRLNQMYSQWRNDPSHFEHLVRKGRPPPCHPEQKAQSMDTFGYSSKLDRLDLELLSLMVAEPSVGVREYARRLGIARGTAQSRIDKMVNAGVIKRFGPDVDPAELGFRILAYVRLNVAQSKLEECLSHLRSIPEIVECSSITGDADLLCRVVALDHEHLEHVLEVIFSTPTIIRTRSEISLSSRIPMRIAQLLDVARKSSAYPRAGEKGGA